MMTIINQKAIIAACSEFGARIGEKLDSREGDAFDIALKACLAALNSKPLTKKASSKPTASKLEKIAKKRAEIQALGGTVDENVTVIKDLNAIIKELKTTKKAEEKAIKDAAKAQEKIKKAEKKAAEAAEKAAKKAAKAAKSPKTDKSEYTIRCFPNDKERDNWKGKNGKFLRYAIHKENRTVIQKVTDNWTDEANAKFKELFPEGKELAKKKIIKKKKITKKKTKDANLEDEQALLIAKLVGTTISEKQSTPVPVAETVVVANPEEEGGESKTAEKSNEPKEKDTVASNDENKEEEEEEIEEIEEIEDIQEIKEEEELDFRHFPGEEDVEEFEHDSLEKYEGIDFYKDSNSNIWDEDMQFVGTFNEDSEELKIRTGYEPEN